MNASLLTLRLLPPWGGVACLRQAERGRQAEAEPVPEHLPCLCSLHWSHPSIVSANPSNAILYPWSVAYLSNSSCSRYPSC